MNDALWPPDEFVSGRRTEAHAGREAGGAPQEDDAPQEEPEHVGSPWSQPPTRTRLTQGSERGDVDAGDPGPWLEPAPDADDRGSEIQHGQPVPHVPVSGAGAIPVSGAGGIPISGAGAVSMPGGGAPPGNGAVPVNGVPVPRPPVLSHPRAAPPPAAPTYRAPATYQPPPTYQAPPTDQPPAPPAYQAPPTDQPPAPPVHQPPPQHQGPAAHQVPPGHPAPSVAHRPPSEAPPPASWSDGSTPTADEFARRRQARPADPVAARGVRGAVSKGTLGVLSLSPGRRELEFRRDVDLVRRNFGGLRQVTVVNPKGGAGKTVAVLLLAMTFGQKRGGYVLAWDNNETQGTLGMRAQQDFHNRTVRDLLRDLDHFQGAQGRVGDLSQYVRAQGEGMFDVLASDESATAGEMLTAQSFGEIRDVVSRFYKLIVVDTGNNVRAENWQAAIDATDQLVVTMSARNDSAETASRMLDHLEQHGRQRLVRQAVTVVSMPPSRRHLDIPAITRHFAARTRTVLLAPYERFIDSGEPIRYGGLTSASRDAWLKVAAAISEGL
ncbi:chromosome partitioning protein [Dactylosporangium sp. NPDC006015]|uniref:MinD/ParA family ATP-binding protein n=1 Tax=Dactylosporangium sp. NPDC006015 TaxID=3154576 RepID=UPI0033B9A2F4